jgi:DNA-binding transcriptional MerR regulator
MDFSAQLEKLQQQASDTTASIRAASAESRDQLKQRIDQARVDANLALMDVKQQAEQTTDQVQSKLAQVKADASAWMDDIKSKIDKRSDERDAKAAAKDADRAERDAVDAIDYAVVTFYSAQLAVLDALDARAYADERAKIAGT